jgi:protein SCO1/2
MDTRPFRHPSVWICALTCAAATCMLTAQAFFSRPSDHWLTPPLPAPNIALVDADDRPVTLATLKGKVWLCDFFLTRCTGICPALTGRFMDLDRQLGADSRYAGVGLLSIAVDPAHDVPAVLREHREKLRLSAQSRWVHATSHDPAALWRMVDEGFKLPVGASEGDPTTPVMHSDNIVLMDAEGRIRGYYGGRDEKEIELLRRDLDYLLAHPQ